MTSRRQLCSVSWQCREVAATTVPTVHEAVFGQLVAAIDGGTMKHSGATLDAPFCHVYRFDGDRIASIHHFTDTARWARLMP
jgi:ketosteroid isomerase-like protein